MWTSAWILLLEVPIYLPPRAVHVLGLRIRTKPFGPAWGSCLYEMLRIVDLKQASVRAVTQVQLLRDEKAHINTRLGKGRRGTRKLNITGPDSGVRRKGVWWRDGRDTYGP